MRKSQQRKENRIPATSVKSMEDTRGNIVNLTPGVPTLINKLMTNNKQASKEEALVEALAEASMEAGALVEVHLESSTTNKSTRINPIQTDHLQQSTPISRVTLLTAIIHHLPEEIGMVIITEIRQSTALQQLMPS